MAIKQLKTLTLPGLTDEYFVPSTLAEMEEDTTHRVVTDTEKAAWNAKYDKPASGIPSTDMASSVQTSLGKADSALQEHQSLAAYRTSAAQDVIDNGKQATISDLSTIRAGAALGATAVQPEQGKGLSTNDYTNADKSKLEGIEVGADVTDAANVAAAGAVMASAQAVKTTEASEVAVDANGKLWYTQGGGGGGGSYVLPQATSNALGGIKADAADAEDLQPCRIGADGKLYTKWSFATLIVTCATQDGVTVTGVTVNVRDTNSSGAIITTAAYNGQPVSLSIARNQAYYVEVVGNLAQHFNPTTASGLASTQSIAVTLTYEDTSHITTFGGIVAAVEAGVGDAIVGKEIEDTWIDENGVSYSDPCLCVSVETVEDANGVQHTAAIMQRKYATLREIQFSAPQQQEATEETAQEGINYYGLTGSSVSAANLTLLTLNVGDAIPYGDYTKIFRNAIRDTSKNILSSGYGRWSHSAYRQYLNSNANAGLWWTAQHEGDCAPANLNNYRGYMAGCSAALLAAAKPIKITSMKNTVTDDGTAETTIDTIWLPSGIQMYGTSNVGEGVYWKYWKDATGFNEPSDAVSSNRSIYWIKNHASSRACWMRSASRHGVHAWYVYTLGYFTYYHAYYAYSCAPAFAIF